MLNFIIIFILSQTKPALLQSPFVCISVNRTSDNLVSLTSNSPVFLRPGGQNCIQCQPCPICPTQAATTTTTTTTAKTPLTPLPPPITISTTTTSSPTTFPGQTYSEVSF